MTSSTPTKPGAVECSRCAKEALGLDRAPLPDELGRQILDHTCAECWREWEEAEVKLINELRLNFLDPEAQQVIRRHLREFLFLDG